MISLNVQNLTQNTIYKSFDYVPSIFGSLENYHTRAKLLEAFQDEVEISFEAIQKIFNLVKLKLSTTSLGHSSVMR